MNALKYVLLAAGLAVSATPTQATDYYPRQYYSSWHKHPSYDYQYRTYYYKPSPTYYTYRHHYVTYHQAPQHKNYVYYYNPYQKKYWGRCPTTYANYDPHYNYNQGEAYSLLKEDDRKETLQQIPEKSFPKPGPMPTIPEATDGAKVELPPDDLPSDVALPKAN